jgi:hypothetical protein
MDESMGQEQRKSTRNKTYAKVLLDGSGILGYLRDLSKEGCQLAFVTDAEIYKGDVVNVQILPAEEMEIPRFSIAVQIMWTRDDPVYHVAGGLITSVQDEQNFNSLFSYYA